MKNINIFCFGFGQVAKNFIDKFILENYTKLPKKMLDNIFEESYALTPTECIKYRISDKIV